MLLLNKNGSQPSHARTEMISLLKIRFKKDSQLNKNITFFYHVLHAVTRTKS